MGSQFYDIEMDQKDSEAHDLMPQIAASLLVGPSAFKKLRMSLNGDGTPPTADYECSENMYSDFIVLLNQTIKWEPMFNCTI